MTSTDSSASNSNQSNGSTSSEQALETTTKVMENEPQLESEVKENNDSTSSSEGSSSPSSSSPASSSPASSNETSTDKTKLEENSKEAKSPSQKTNNLKQKSSFNQNPNCTNLNEHSPIASGTTSQQAHQQFINYYPTYVPRQGGQTTQSTVNPQAAPYTQLDINSGQSWPQAMAAAAAMAAMAANDPMSLAAYMNNGTPVAGGPHTPYQAGTNELSHHHYDQFSFGFTPAFGFGYTGNGSVDYAALAAAQQGSALNPQSNQWTPSTNSAATTNGNSTSQTNPSSSPANTTTSSNDTTSSTTTSENSVANQAKWVHVMQDPLAIHEFNTFQAQQLSPVDLYTQQHHHHHSYRPHQHHHYQRHQHLQPNYHHYQYNNPYQMQHYHNNYANVPHQHSMHHHYNHNPNKNYYHKNNNQNQNDKTNGSHSAHDNNNNSNKSNNLNAETSKNDKSSKQPAEGVDPSEDVVGEESTAESKSDSKTWASIVGVSNALNTAQSGAVLQQQTAAETQQEQQEQQQQQQQFQPLQNTNFNEYSNYMKKKNNYYRNNNTNYKQNSYENLNQQQNNNNVGFDLTNRSFPPIGVNSCTSTKAELSEHIKKSTLKKSQTENPIAFEPSTYNQNAQQFTQNNKKQQQYNNYQRQQQQQFNLPYSKSTQHSYQQNGMSNYSFNAPQKPAYSNSTESQVNREKPLSAHYYKRHQPTQPTLSSFLTDLDKNKFVESKANANSDNKLNGTLQMNNVNGDIADSTISLINQQGGLHIDPSQLTIYTNPSAYNPKEFNTSPKAARFFVIKSYSEDDIHRSIKYNIWCSTEHGNRRLDSAYFKGDGQVPVYLFFSVNGSGHFCGMAEMQSRVDYNKKTGVWSQDKWRGCFQVKWIYVKDVPNSLLRNIKLENNDNKPVTNSRDTQEIPYDKGRQVLKVFHTYNHSSSILDDFEHYERKQEEDKTMLKVTQTFESAVVLNGDQLGANYEMSSNQKEINKEENNSVQNSSQTTATVTNTTTSSVTSSPSTSSSSSTSSIDESKQTKVLEPQNPQLISTSS